MEIEIEMDDHKIMGKLADISMSGAGFYVTISEQEAAMFQRGAKVFLTIHLAEGKVRLLGTLRSVERTVDAYRLAAEFTENVPEKVIILHYVTRRQGEIRQEVQKMYEVAYKARLQQA
jgi:hypothetical protein